MSQSTVKPSKIRWQLLVIIYFACLIAYLDRTNLAVCATYIMDDLGFDRVALGYTMSAFFLGYTIFQIPGSLMSDRFGVRITIALALAWWSLFTIFTPLAWGFISFMVIRFCFGMGEAPLFPGISAFFTRWFSFKEKALANSGMLMGVFFAPAIGPYIVVKLVENFGWRSAFYSFGIAGLAAALVWWWYARETPQQHKNVNQGEIDAVNLGRNEAQIANLAKKEPAPWGKFMRSRQFWAIGIQYSIANYIMYLFLSWIPLYLMEARHMSFQRMGIAAAAPWLCLTAAVFFGGILSDRMVAAGMSKLKSRTALAVCGFAVCMLGLYMGAKAESQATNLIWLSISLGALGTAYVASWAGCQDLGAKFGGSVSAWMNTWGNLSGAAAPVITAYLVNSLGWQGALSATSGFIIIGCIAWFFVRPDKPLVEV